MSTALSEVFLYIASGAALLSVSACDQVFKPATQPSPVVIATPPPELGRWMVVPVASPIMQDGRPYVLAWRLDTKTGALEMCTYESGGWIEPLSKSLVSESVLCGAMARAYPVE